jgi:hypothetical protein
MYYELNLILLRKLNVINLMCFVVNIAKLGTVLEPFVALVTPQTNPATQNKKCV